MLRTAPVGDPAWPTEEAVCEALAPRIRAYGRRHLSAAAAAEDLVQDVLTLIIEALRAGKIAAPAALPAYALSVSRNLVRDRVRTASRRATLLGRLEAGQEEAAPSGEGVEARDLARVARCLDRLPDRERNVLVRSFVHGEDSDRIAADLGVATGNLRVIRHRAIVRLRALLDGSESVEESSP